ncbi:MAG: hypothetical protein PW790_04755 [Parvibaculaceae bacterium]|nr:hypothetical protein [Parvibaculaceae bacterium]
MKFASKLAGTGFAALMLMAATAPAFALATITGVDQSPLYTPQSVSAGGFRAQVFGGPTASATAEETVAPLTAPGNFGGGPLKPIDAAERSGGRLVLIFNGAPTPTEAACSDPASLGGKSANGPLHVIAVYCLGDRWLARGALSGVDVTGTQDPAYARAMTNLFAAMLPMHSIDMPNGSNGQ